MRKILGAKYRSFIHSLIIVKKPVDGDVELVHFEQKVQFCDKGSEQVTDDWHIALRVVWIKLQVQEDTC